MLLKLRIKMTVFERNLIKNPCGEERYRYWSVKSGGDGWNIDNNHIQIPEAYSQKCFVTSYRWCSKEQLINLLAEGATEDELDKQPEIYVCDWYGTRSDCGGVYEIHVTLLDADKSTVKAEFKCEAPPIPQWNDASYHKVSHNFRNYGKGVRYVNFCHRGKDTKFWAGHYGTRITNSTVIVKASS
ncbi:F-box only protein 27-like [Protopterus annectens]|uniref:F-box only protein 27-like n=1 Tax=Protopterus annectens TaxID=7888 RepID=UPI001CFB7921|nr:F-box only protein 27-like [Protopterus annectens]